jgi:hypothetical protein
MGNHSHSTRISGNAGAISMIMQRDQFGDVGGTLATNLEPVGKASAGLA